MEAECSQCGANHYEHIRESLFRTRVRCLSCGYEIVADVSSGKLVWHEQNKNQ